MLYSNLLGLKLGDKFITLIMNKSYQIQTHPAWSRVINL